MKSDPRVVKYIKSELNRGISKDKVVDALVGAGHKHEHVKHAFSKVENKVLQRQDNKIVKSKSIHTSAILTKNLGEHANRDTWLMMLLAIAFIVGIILAVIFGFKAMIPDEIEDTFKELNSDLDNRNDVVLPTAIKEVKDIKIDNGEQSESLSALLYKSAVRDGDISICYNIPNDYYKKKCISELN